MNEGQIILIEEDLEDQDIIKEAIDELKPGRDLLCFSTGTDFIEWLKANDAKPFLILCSLYMAHIDGIDLRKRIDSHPELRKKSIPFVFLTTDSRRSTVEKAYETTVQGYFLKADQFNQLVNDLKTILDYWALCRHPNSPA